MTTQGPDHILLQAKAYGDAQSIKNVDLRCRIIVLQQRLADRLQAQANSIEVTRRFLHSALDLALLRDFDPAFRDYIH